MRGLRVLVAWLSMFSAVMLGPFLPAMAQQLDCGNGLVQRLQVGSRGWINLEPPLLPTRIRSAPSGETIAVIEPGTSFTVLSGPTCNAIGTSWWEVRTDDGIVGWLPEGDKNGYYIDPLEEQADCIDTLPSLLRAGQTVRTQNPVDTPAYLINEAPAEWDRESPFDVSPDYISFEREPVDTSVVLAEGPICISGEYAWRVWNNDSHQELLWLLETHDGNYALDVIDSATSFVPAFEATEINLNPRTSAPIIDALAQISPMPGGGDVYPSLDMLYVGSPLASMPLIFPSRLIGQHAELRLYQPDGTLFSTHSEAIEEFNSQALVQYQRPNLPGQQLGAWIIEANVGSDFTKSWAYELSEYVAPQIWPDKHAGFYPYLSVNGESVFVLTGFKPNSSVTLVFVTANESSNELWENYRWKISVGQHGEAILRIEDNSIDDYYLIVADKYGDWRERYYDAEMFGYSSYDGSSNFVSGLRCTEYSRSQDWC